MQYSVTKKGNQLKTVCHLSSHHAPNSGRIFMKQCVSLAKAGYNVFYIVPGTGPQVVNGVNFFYAKKINNLFGRLLIDPLLTFIAAMKIKAEVFHFHDPEDVADKIKKALDFGKKTNGREKIKHLDQKIIAEKIIGVYNRVLDNIIP